MYMRISAMVAAGLLILQCQLLRAQSDTNEGGGPGNERQVLFNGLDERLRALETWQAEAVSQEADDIKEELREAELIEAIRRKLLEFEKRIKALENRRSSNDRTAPQISDAQGNDVRLNGTNLQSPPTDSVLAPRQSGGAALAVDGDRWRFQRFQGRWWYWTPGRQWLYWSGDRWTALPMPPASAPGSAADK